MNFKQTFFAILKMSALKYGAFGVIWLLYSTCNCFTANILKSLSLDEFFQTCFVILKMSAVKYVAFRAKRIFWSFLWVIWEICKMEHFMLSFVRKKVQMLFLANLRYYLKYFLRFKFMQHVYFIADLNMLWCYFDKILNKFIQIKCDIIRSKSNIGFYSNLFSHFKNVCS